MLVVISFSVLRVCQRCMLRRCHCRDLNAHLQGQDVYVACKLAMAELILSGCTTTSDHLYIYPNDVKIEDSIRAARCAPICAFDLSQYSAVCWLLHSYRCGRLSAGKGAMHREIGIRFHPTRGAMSLGQSKGGLPPDSCTEDEGACLADMQRAIEQFHDNSRSHPQLHLGFPPDC